MKYLQIFSLVLFLGFNSCSAPEKPEFKAMKNVTARFVSPSEMVLSGISVYYNPNIVGGNLTSMNVNVWIDNINVGKLDQELSVAVPGLDTFEVPFEMGFNPEKVFEQKGILGSILSMLEKQSVQVKYVGNMKMEVMNVEFAVPVDYIEEISLNK